MNYIPFDHEFVLDLADKVKKVKETQERRDEIKLEFETITDELSKLLAELETFIENKQMELLL